MNVCIDAQAAVGQRAGVGRYTARLIRGLAAEAGADRLSAFCFDFRGRGSALASPHVQLRPCRWPGRLARFGWDTLGWPTFDRYAGPADVYHFPNFVVPPLARGRAVVTVHDVSFVRFPQFAETRNLRYLTARIRGSLDRADAIITDSEFSAREIADALGAPRERIAAIHLGIGEEFAPPSPERRASVLKRLGLDGPYLLTVGTVEPRKNLPFLVDVFERLGGFAGALVIAGMPGWKTGPILERIDRSRRREDIRYLRFVDDADLPALYAGAAVFVLTSFYEGFGFPPLEAMACGAPVVSSDGGSLPEVLGSAARIVPGFDAGDWAAEIERVLADPELRKAMREAGRRHAARFTWAETARRTWDVYRRLGGRESGSS